MATFSPDDSKDEAPDQHDNDNAASDQNVDCEIVIIGKEVSGHEDRSGIGEGKEGKEGPSQRKKRERIHCEKRACAMQLVASGPFSLEEEVVFKT